MYLKKQKGSVIFESLAIPILFIGFFSVFISFYQYEVSSVRLNILGSSISKITSSLGVNVIPKMTKIIVGNDISSISYLKVSENGINNIRAKNGYSCKINSDLKRYNQKIYAFLKKNKIKNIEFITICSKSNNPLFPDIQVRTVLRFK